MATADDFIAVLDSWVAQGIHEDPPRSNDTPIGAEFGWNGVAWCCETQSVAQDRVGLHCFHTASVAEAINEAKQGLRGMVYLRPDARIARGDLSCFDFGPAYGEAKGNPANFHISAVRDPGTQAKFQTDGGNESDAMRTQWRDRTYVQGFIRLPFDQPAPGPTPPQEDDEMGIRIISYKGAKTDPDRVGQFVILDGVLFPVPDNLDAEDLINAGGKYLEVDQPLYDAVAKKAGEPGQ